MKNMVFDRLLRREIGQHIPYSSVRSIYGDVHWVDELDIINELEGHSGCVNALSWSKNGRLLASGSDDQHLNIYAFQPEYSSQSFKLATTVSTGHQANIFSVKFMPHSSDRTLVTAAGDNEIRVFDIEYSGRSSLASNVQAQATVNQGVRYLNFRDANHRVYRSHNERVKRIVTESSPHLFLSCSEDGDVRQWDLRQPSSAYPRPKRGSRGWPNGSASTEDSDVPPPLISYKKWDLDLNTISCSPSQPHYIALGGTHLHCFLHDRRMLGRDLLSERTGETFYRSSRSGHDEELLNQATRCVRRFAPDGQRSMNQTKNGHITACKISDANPNELVASWSGDWIYSFDMIRSPDARDQNSRSAGSLGAEQKSLRVRESREKKRKRDKDALNASRDLDNRRASKQRICPALDREDEEEVALRVRYENGQSENIPLRWALSEDQPAHILETESVMTEKQKRSYRIANAILKIRKHMFKLGDRKDNRDDDSIGYASSFTTALGFSASVLEDMDDIMQNWSYPMNPDVVEVAVQNTLRKRRQSARRFVQAAGTVSRLLGGKVRTAGSNLQIILDFFTEIVPTPNEIEIDDDHERFSYDFLKAIVLWLSSGPSALIEGFSLSKGTRRTKERFPIPDGETIEAIDEILIPYLLALADKRKILDVDTSRFEIDQNRTLYECEKTAVISFARAVRIPFEDLLSSDINEDFRDILSSTKTRTSQSRSQAVKFWGYKVARGILLNAGHGLTHSFVDRAFGGLGRPHKVTREEERSLKTQMQDINPNDEDENMASGIDLIKSYDEDQMFDSAAVTIETVNFNPDTTTRAEEGASDEEYGGALSIEDVRDATVDESRRDQIASRDVTEYSQEEEEEEEEADVEEDEDEDDSENDEDDDDEDDDDDDDDNDQDDEDNIFGFSRRHSIWRSTLGRSSIGRKIQTQVPCYSHTRVYKGHCNTKTVKDVNFYGPNDEYVVSGSDSGHVFIWDRLTSQIVNILEGDGEVVNVVQGHPYEPILAVSGIDHTIKIFGADSRARSDARKGVGISEVDPTNFSSIHTSGPLRLGVRRQASTTNASIPKSRRHSSSDKNNDESSDSEAEPPPNSHGLTSRKRMKQEYQITSQNDVARRGGGNNEAFISRNMLTQIAAHMRMHQSMGHPIGGGGSVISASGDIESHGNEGDDGDDDDEGFPIALVGPGGDMDIPDDCQIM